MTLTAFPTRTLLATLALAWVAGPAWADPPSADAVQTQLRAALGGIGQSATSPLTVTKTGEDYRILFPIGGMNSAAPDQPPGLLAVTHPVDGGRWAIDSLTVPSDSTVSLTGGATMHVTVGGQTAAGVFDPSYATPSTLDAGATGVRTESSSVQANQHTSYDKHQLHVGLTPHAGAGAGAGLDMAQTTQVSGLHMAAEGRTPFTLDAAHAALNGTVIDLSPDRVGALYGAVIGLMGTLIAGPGGPPPAAAPGPMPINPATLRPLLAALPGLADKLDVTEAADRVILKAADGHTYTFDHAGIGFGGEAVAGVLGTYMDVSLENLQSPDSPDDVRALLPRLVHLHPTISGIGTAELLALANAAAAMTGKGDSGAMIAAGLGLFAHGGIHLAITDLAIEIGDSSITGTGKLDLPAPLPTVFKGEGVIVAKHLDALIARLQADPKTAQQAAMLTTAKQFAKPDGEALVWNIAYHDGAVFVNGKPLSPQRPARPKDQ
jgi:hypothetical protein